MGTCRFPLPMWFNNVWGVERVNEYLLGSTQHHCAVWEQIPASVIDTPESAPVAEAVAVVQHGPKDERP